MPPSSLLLPPWTLFVSSGALRLTADGSASQGVRSCLAFFVAATPLDPFRLLGSAPPHGGRLREPGGPQLPRLARCCYPPGPFSSPRERSASRRTAPRARGSAAASLGSLLLPPWTLFVSSGALRLTADRSASQGVRSCLASLVAATPLDPFRLLGSAPPHGGPLREPGGPQLPRFARCCYPPGPRRRRKRSMSSGSITPTSFPSLITRMVWTGLPPMRWTSDPTDSSGEATAAVSVPTMASLTVLSSGTLLAIRGEMNPTTRPCSITGKASPSWPTRCRSKATDIGSSAGIVGGGGDMTWPTVAPSMTTRRRV